MEKLSRKMKLSGWGNNKFVNCKVHYPKNITELKTLIKNDVIVRGLGRSYGDSSIQPNLTIITSKLKKILYFDKKKGIIEVESGISVKDLIKETISKGWFLPVTPGSKNISIGGMVASDVHGKNHHKVGSFRNFITELKMLNYKKKVILCNKKKNNKLFNYSIGGMGLTGLIYSCRFKLKKISSDLIFQETLKNKNLKETIKSFENSKNWEYNVAWLDSSANKKSFGRSILYRAHHVKKGKSFINFKEKNSIKIPNLFPSWFMNKYTIKLLNFLYFLLSSRRNGEVSLDKYFYPLDSISNWNVVYGKKGFITYQFVVPYKNSYKVISQILNILLSNKIYSFVSVIKLMKKNDKYLSFGKKGFSLVFDFPIYDNIHQVLNKIDKIIIVNNGDIYLTKDSRINKNAFKKINKRFYSSSFKKFRKKKDVYFSSLQSERLKI